MTIEVRILVTKDQILRGTTARLDVASPACVGDVLLRLVEQDCRFADLALDKGPALAVRPGLALLLNGVNVSLSQGLKTPVADGDRISLIHAISGG